jgi:acyl-CoA thioester hydrolase
MRYTKIFIVRWSDSDANGHMRNTAYSEYAMDTRMGYLAEHGFPYPRFEEMGFAPVLLREEIDYLRELRLGDTVEVDFTQLGLAPDASRVKFVHDFWRPGGKKVARIVVSGGWMGIETRKLIRPPEALVEAIAGVPKAEGWDELPPIKRRPAEPA